MSLQVLGIESCGKPRRINSTEVTHIMHNKEEGRRGRRDYRMKSAREGGGGGARGRALLELVGFL
jgi:hypothetical protein